MGFTIPCPRCGDRPYTEFAFGGEIRPLEDPATSDEEDFERIWMHENPAGIQTERWFHAAGCRRWLTLRRDVATNELHGLV